MTKLHHAWIWFWYRDITRFLVVLIPSYFIILIPFLYWIGIEDSETIKQISTVTYLVVILLSMKFNNYENLYKIGRDINGKKLKKD